MTAKKKLTMGKVMNGVKTGLKFYGDFGKAFVRGVTGRDSKAIVEGRTTKYKKGKKKNFIQSAIKKPGALRKSLGVKVGQKIPGKKLAVAANKGGKMGQRARFAQTLRKMS